MIHIVTGLPGSGKSLYLAEQTVDLLYEAKEAYEKHGIKRQIATNLKMSDAIENEFGFKSEHSYLRYWSDTEELPLLEQCDVIWEEMGAYVDSRRWESMSLDLRRWLAQHRHHGVEIYGNVQEFADIDISVRRLTQELIYLVKLMGSRDPHPTRPKPKWVWGVSLKLRLDPKSYKEEMKFMKERWSWDGILTINKKNTGYYDMYNHIEAGELPPLQHQQRKCLDCGYVKTSHA